ncbi:MAG: tripartite tricarboxylate transporter TctB family protein [Pseudomonadota bacterium]
MSDRPILDRTSPVAGLTGRRRDLVLGVMLVLFAWLLHLWIIPWQVNDEGSFGLAPSFAPRILAWLILGLGCVLIVLNLHGSREAGMADEGGPVLTFANLSHLALCIGTTALMLLLMRFAGAKIGWPYAGFLAAAPLGLLALTWIHGRAPGWAFAFNAVLIPPAIYLAFWFGLGLPLP